MYSFTKVIYMGYIKKNHWVFLLILFSILGCNNTPSTNTTLTSNNSNTVIAQVGPHAITLNEFQDFSFLIPDGMKKGDTQLAKERQVLNSLIDKHLMLLETSSLAIDQDTKLLEELTLYSRTRLLELYTKQAIADQVSISDEEMEAHYRATHRDRALRFSGIMLKTLEEAQEILLQVRSGANFMELAKGHSLHSESADQGGDIGGYKLKDKVVPTIANAIFPLQIGEMSEPILLAFEGSPHYAIFQVTDEMPAPIAVSERKIREEVFGKKRADRYIALLDSLTAVYQPELQTEQISWLAQYSQQATKDALFDVPEGQRDNAMCTYRDGQITLATFLQNARAIHSGFPELADSSRIAHLLNTVIIPGYLFEAEARADSLHNHQGLLQRIQTKKEDLLISALRDRYVDQYVEATAAEARAFYDNNPKKFISPLTTEIVEILVDSETRAQEFKDQLVAGADPFPLAREHTTRYGADHHDGKLTINIYTKAYYQKIYDLAQELEIGAIGGPIKAENGFSVFKVLERKQPIREYNADSQRRSFAYVKIDKSKRSYVKYVRSLREKFQVEIFEKKLEDLFAADMQ